MDEQETRDLFSGMPWYIKAVALVGIPSLISLGLVYTNEVKLIQTVEHNRYILEQMAIKDEVHDRGVQTKFDSLDGQSKVNEKLLRLICSGVVEPQLRQACWKE